MGDKSLHSGHRERLRSRFLSTGLIGFREHEMLELLLFYAIPRANTNEIAHDLLNRFGSISEILKADESDLKNIKGIGDAAVSLIKLMDSVTSSIGRLSAERSEEDILKAIELDLINRCGTHDEDRFTIYYISSQNRVTDTCDYSVNDFLKGSLRLRKVVEDAVTIDASSIIIGICHNKKLPIPEDSDYLLIKNISEFLAAIDITVEDAIIAGSGSCFSLRRDGAFSF